MEGFELGRLAYLVLLLLAIGSYYVAQGRSNLGRNAQYAVVWGLLFVGVVAVFGLWNDMQDDLAPRQRVIGEQVIEVPRSFDGHYYLRLHLNGKSVEFVVDTGASDVVLSRQDAERIGLDLNALEFSGVASTANGMVRTARANVAEFRIGKITDRDVDVSVNDGEMEGSLLGMTYLQRFEKIEISENKLRLSR